MATFFDPFSGNLISSPDKIQSGGDLQELINIDDLLDVDTSTTPPTDGQILTWVNANNQWEPSSIDGSSLTFSAGTEALPGIAFNGDPNTGIYSPGADTVGVSTAGTERMRIDSAGYVKLSTGVLELGTEDSTNGIINSPESIFINIDSNNDSTDEIFAIGKNRNSSSGGAELFRVNEAGNVGIGTSSPGQKLTVASSDASVTAIQIVNSATGTTATDGFEFKVDANGFAYINNYESTKLFVGTNNSIGLTLDTSNNVGIGTTSPGSYYPDWHQLVVGDASGSKGITIATGSVGSGTLAFADGTSLTDRYRGYIQYNHSVDALTFATAATEAMRIDSSGRLLVGTSASRNVGSGQPALMQIETTAGRALSMVHNGADNNGGYLLLGKTRGSSVGSNTIVANGDEIFAIRFAGADGTDLQAIAAQIKAEVDGTPGVDDMPGRLVFSTTADGANIPTERMRIDSAGRLLVGTSAVEQIVFGGTGSAALAQQSLVGGDENSFGLLIKNTGTAANIGGTLSLARSRSTANASVNVNDTLGAIQFLGADGTDIKNYGALIECEVDGTPGANNMPGRLVFSTTADGASSPTERMRIDNSGTVSINGIKNFDTYCYLEGDTSKAGTFRINYTENAATSRKIQHFYRANTEVGSISITNAATSYTTTSDYRLKENVVAVTDGIARLKQLKPARFNFIVDPDRTVDGFIAHEVQDIVPEAITGEKDAVDEDGNPIHQGIDQSKLVPLLTAALQEAIGEIELLKARVAALEAN